MLPNKENSLIKLFSVISNQKTIFPTQNREQLFKSFLIILPKTSCYWFSNLMFAYSIYLILEKDADKHMSTLYQ